MTLESKQPRKLTNREFADNDGTFKAACEKAGVYPSSRQASKFRCHRGKAFNQHLQGAKRNEEE